MRDSVPLTVVLAFLVMVVVVWCLDVLFNKQPQGSSRVFQDGSVMVQLHASGK